MAIIKLTKDCDKVKYQGRMRFEPDVCYLSWSASEIGILYSGEELFGEFITDEAPMEPILRGVIAVYVGAEKREWRRFTVNQPEEMFCLFSRKQYADAMCCEEKDLPNELPIRIVKLSEAAFGMVGIRELKTENEREIRPLPKKEKKIAFIGDSITCGYGNEGIWGVDLFNTQQENPSVAYAVLAAEELDCDYELVCWSGIGVISGYVPPEVNEPDTTILMGDLYPYTASDLDRRLGKEPEKWNFTAEEPNVIVINIGTNDDSYARRIPERTEIFAEVYKEFVRSVRKGSPSAAIVCTLGLMSGGLCPEVERTVRELNAEGDTHIYYLAMEEQKEEDGIGTDSHPSRKTHAKAAAVLAEAIRPLL